MNVWKIADPDKGKEGSYEVEKWFFSSYNFVKNCSVVIKTIIAFYSKKIDRISSEENIWFAEALGKFSSLEEAQQTLLKDKEQYFAKVKTDYPFIDYLEIEIKENKVFVSINDREIDEYSIQNNGSIQFLENKKIK